MQKNTLSKSERIKSRKIIEELFSDGRYLFVHPLKLVYKPVLKEFATSQLMFGVTVPKRIHKTAVSRNQIKRLVREAYRSTKPQFLEHFKNKEQAYALMFIYVHRDSEGLEEVKKAIEKLERKFLKAISL